MVKITLFIACSLDGFIARKNGDISWLPNDQDYGYKDFFKSIDVVFVGNSTYKQAKTFEEFPFKGKDVYVFTRDTQKSADPNITYMNENVKNLLPNFKNKKIWLVGGGELIKDFLIYDLVDEFIISIIPILIGEGISLFQGGFNDRKLKLKAVRTFDSGLAMLHYERAR